MIIKIFLSSLIALSFFSSFSLFMNENICLAKKKETAEIYFTKINAEDPFDKNNQITEGIYTEPFNIVGIGFSKSETVQIYLDEKYIGDKSIENGQFVGQFNIPKETEEKTHKIKIEGEARGETLETEILMKMPAVIPSWFLILIGLLIIGGIVYFIYIRIFQE